MVTGKDKVLEGIMEIKGLLTEKDRKICELTGGGDRPRKMATDCESGETATIVEEPWTKDTR